MEPRLFDDARRMVRVEDLAASMVKLRASGGEKRGPCPLCGSGAFAVKLKKQTWVCYVCEKHGDVTDLEMALRGGTLVEAAKRLVGDAPMPVGKPVQRPAKAPEGPSAAALIALELWREGQAFAGSKGERYYRGRGIADPVIAAAAGNLRFHPNAKWTWDGDRRLWRRAPAILALVVVADVDGKPRATQGVHATYLTPDGRAKVAGPDGKRMWGRQGLDDRPGGTWLIGPQGAGPTATAEGIENALSLATLHYRRSGEVIRTCAALSLNRLQGGLLRDNEQRLDPYDIQPDAERPAFVWPGLGEVWIGIDRDMKPLRVKGRTPRGRDCWFWLDAEARARICAKLASAAWAAAGAKPTAIWASIGADLNDDLKRLLARSGSPKSKRAA